MKITISKCCLFFHIGKCVKDATQAQRNNANNITSSKCIDVQKGKTTKRNGNDGRREKKEYKFMYER